MIQELASKGGVKVYVLSYLTNQGTLDALLSSLCESDLEDHLSGIIVCPARVGWQGKAETISKFAEFIPRYHCLLVDDSPEIVLESDSRGLAVRHIWLEGRPWVKGSIQWHRSLEEARADLLQFCD